MQVNYKKPKNFYLTPNRKRVTKAVCRGSKMKVVSECMKDSKMQNYTIQLIGRILRKEMTSLCSDSAKSMLREKTASALTQFTWGRLYDELSVHAPTLLAVLESCTCTRKPRPNRTAVVGMCVAVLLKFRFQNMCLVQKIISLILYSGHSGKQVNNRYLVNQFIYILQCYTQVFQRLQKVNVCLSHQATTTLVNTLGSNHDKSVLQWRDTLADTLGDSTEVINIIRYRK